jgi:hypothetical protein
MVQEVWKRNRRVRPRLVEREVTKAVEAVRAKGTRQKV